MNSLTNLIGCVAPGTYHFDGQYWFAEEGLDHKHEFAFECDVSYEQDFVFAWGELNWATEADIPGFALSIPRNDQPPSVISVALTLPNMGTLAGRAYFTGHGLEAILHSELATLSSHIRVRSPESFTMSGVFENQDQHYGFVLTGSRNGVYLSP